MTKDVLITPADGKVEFSDNTESISIRVEDDTLSFEGDTGQLMSITDNLLGILFSVNDISGLPVAEIDDEGNLDIAGEFQINNIKVLDATNGADKLDGKHYSDIVAEIDSDIATHTSNIDAHHSESHTVASHSDTSVTGAQLDADHSKLAGIESGATCDLTAAEILTSIKTVDGSGSGLDADMLDGNEATAFATFDHTHGMNDLYDVGISGLSLGDVLQWTQVGWINKHRADSGFALDSHNHDDDYVNLAGSNLTGSMLYSGSQNYKGLYWGAKYEDELAHDGGWGYIRQKKDNPGMLEIGSDQYIDFYETDTRTRAVRIDVNGGSVDANLFIEGGEMLTARYLGINDTAADSDLLDGLAGSSYEHINQKGAINGYAGLGADGKIPLLQIPDTARQQTYVVVDLTARNALTDLITGERAYITSTGDTDIWDGDSWETVADADWQNVSLDWANIINGPSTTPTQIDNDHLKLGGIESGATADQTAAEILTAIKTVDGTGSGLDADKLDGNEASAFLMLSGGVMTGKITTPNGTMGVRFGDDCEMGDINVSNMVGVRGVQDSTLGGFVFGSDNDTNLYRSAANILKTDDEFRCNIFESAGLAKADIFTANSKSSTGALILKSGDQNNTPDDYVQIAFGYDGTNDYQNYIVTRHSYFPVFSAIEFYTSDGTQAGVYPTNAVMGLSVVGGGIRLPTGMMVNEFSADETLAGDSMNTVPTESAVKAYVDNSVHDELHTIASHSDTSVTGAELDADHSKLTGIESGATADLAASEILTLIKTVDGTGSGLDADKLDGQEYINMVIDWENYTDGAVSAHSANADIHHAELHTIASHSDTTVTGAELNTDHSKLAGIEAGATADQTAAEILTAIKTVDGSGSGLDADTLDGNEASAFAISDHSHTLDGLSDVATFTPGWGEIIQFRQPQGWTNATLTEAGIAGIYHDHDADYLGLTAKAADSEKLDGINGASYLRSDITDTYTAPYFNIDSQIIIDSEWGNQSLEITHNGSITETLSIWTDDNYSYLRARQDEAGNGRFSFEAEENTAAEEAFRFIVNAALIPTTAFQIFGDEKARFSNSIGVGNITPGSTFDNGKAIAIGDNDTGIRQNGDGVLELWANNEEIMQMTTTQINMYKNLAMGAREISTDTKVIVNKYSIEYNSTEDSLDFVYTA